MITRNRLLDFHTFNSEDYEKEVYEVLTFSSKKIPGYPNDGKMTNLLTGDLIPMDHIYMVRIATETIQGIDPTYIEE